MATSHPFGTEDNSSSSSSRETTNSLSSETLSRFPENLLSEGCEDRVDPSSGNDSECVTCRLSRLREPVQTPCGHLHYTGSISRSIR